MALQWTPLRRRDGAVVRARQNVQTLEHQTQSNVLLAFKLSMVSGNTVSTVPRLNRTYRKMADIGVQCDPQDSDFYNEPPTVNSTVAEINNFPDVDASTTSPPPFHRPLSVESSTSISSGEERERRRQLTNEELDVDAICVQQSSAEEDLTENLNNLKSSEKTEPDGFVVHEKEESTCGLDCLYFTMQCCECTII